LHHALWSFGECVKIHTYPYLYGGILFNGPPTIPYYIWKSSKWRLKASKLVFQHYYSYAVGPQRYFYGLALGKLYGILWIWPESKDISWGGGRKHLLMAKAFLWPLFWAMIADDLTLAYW